MKSLVALCALLSVVCAQWPAYYPGYPPFYPPPHYHPRFDGPRHHLDVHHRDRHIQHLRQRNAHANKTISAISGHLESFREHVAREHDLHKSNFAKLNSEIDEHKQQIASLQNVVKRLNQNLAMSRSMAAEEHQQKVLLGQTLDKISAQYQLLHAKVLELHAQIRTFHDRRIREYSLLAEMIKNQIKVQEYRKEKDAKDAAEDEQRFKFPLSMKPVVEAPESPEVVEAPVENHEASVEHVAEQVAEEAEVSSPAPQQ